MCSLGAHKLFYTHQLVGCDAHLGPFFGLGIPVVPDNMHLSSVMALIHRTQIFFYFRFFVDARPGPVRKTVLYIPLEALEHSPEVAAREKELVKRLEGKDQEGAMQGKYTVHVKRISFHKMVWH